MACGDTNGFYCWLSVGWRRFGKCVLVTVSRYGCGWEAREMGVFPGSKNKDAGLSAFSFMLTNIAEGRVLVSCHLSPFSTRNVG